MHKNKTRRQQSFYLGIAFIVSGVLFNKWFIESTFVADKVIESFSYRLIIILFEIVSVIIGTYLLIKQPARRMPTKREFFLACLSIFIALLMLETGARIWLNFFATPEQWQKYVLYSDLSPKELPWSRHHYLNYYPTPHYELGLTTQNSSGYRNREFATEKPDGVYRIAVLGGSSAYDVAVKENDKTFASRLEQMLRNTYGYQNVEVINAAVGGYASWESLINLEFRVLDIDPDLVIIHPESDDVHARLVSPAAYHGDNSGSRKQWEPPVVSFFERSCFLRVLGRNLGITSPVSVQSFVTALTYKGACSADYDQNNSDASAKELLRRNPPVYLRRNLLNMAVIAKAKNIKIMFSTFAYSPYFNDYASTPHYREGFAENDNIIKEIAYSGNIPLFDFAKVMSRDVKYWADSCQVNEEGALLKATLYADFIHESKLISR